MHPVNSIEVDPFESCTIQISIDRMQENVSKHRFRLDCVNYPNIYIYIIFTYK